jgi:hypothetical protein
MSFLRSVVVELKRRFARYLETGDESVIPADLVRATYATAVREGSAYEYEEMKKIEKDPKNPAQRSAAMCVPPVTLNSCLLTASLPARLLVPSSTQRLPVRP